MDSSSLLRKVVENFAPDTWESFCYDNTVAALFDLSSRDHEYQVVAEEFNRNGITPTHIKRVQHPYRYGQYLLRKEQMSIRGQSTAEQTVYHGVDVQHVKVAVETCCDTRRYMHTKEPTFYTSPGSAKNFTYCSEIAILVLKQLISSKHDLCPMYVVYI